LDYQKLAHELMQKMVSIHKAKHIKNIEDDIRGEVFVLYYINQKSTGEVLPSELSAATGISTSRIALTLNSLEKKALISRSIDVSDRRRILVKLTQKGKEAAQQQINKILADITNMLTLLGEQDAKEYTRIMGKIADAMLQLNN